jgi:predicted acylesterase/phospholipase RssA
LEELVEERLKMSKMEDFVEETCKIPKIDIKNICCVSVGSIIGLLYILKYDYIQLQNEILNVKMDLLKDIKIKNFLTKYGLDSGNNIMSWIETLMIKKGISKDITFDELYKLSGIKFRVLATNLNKYKLTIFDHVETPKMIVSKAIRMSISIPVIFSYKKFKGDIHVDGGLVNNYPINLYSENLDNVLGLKIISTNEYNFEEIDEQVESFDNYIYHIMKCMIVQKERFSSLSLEYRLHTVYIQTDQTQIINFNLNEEDKIKMIEIGYKNTCDFFNKC